MNAVVFGKNNYGGQILNDLSPFYGLLYPFRVVDKNDDWIIVKKPQFPNIHFIFSNKPKTISADISAEFLHTIKGGISADISA